MLHQARTLMYNKHPRLQMKSFADAHQTDGVMQNIDTILAGGHLSSLNI